MGLRLLLSLHKFNLRCLSLRSGKTGSTRPDDASRGVDGWAAKPTHSRFNRSWRQDAPGVPVTQIPLLQNACFLPRFAVAFPRDDGFWKNALNRRPPRQRISERRRFPPTHRSLHSRGNGAEAVDPLHAVEPGSVAEGAGVTGANVQRVPLFVPHTRDGLQGSCGMDPANCSGPTRHKAEG